MLVWSNRRASHVHGEVAAAGGEEQRQWLTPLLYQLRVSHYQRVDGRGTHRAEGSHTATHTHTTHTSHTQPHTHSTRQHDLLHHQHALLLPSRSLHPTLATQSFFTHHVRPLPRTPTFH